VEYIIAINGLKGYIFDMSIHCMKNIMNFPFKAGKTPSKDKWDE
jgi:hypothetical protein